MKRVLFCTIMFCILLLVVYSNGAKSMELPDGNGGVYFDENPNIALVAEEITFTMLEERSMPRAKVTVDYDMRNTLGKDQSFKMFFVVPNIGEYALEEPYRVFIDGKEVTTVSEYMEMDKPENWRPNFAQGLQEPYSKKAYYTDIDKNGSMKGFDIPVDFKAGSDMKLRIEYLCEGGYYRSDDYEHTIYSFVYYLTPAKFWNGEPKVTLNVDFNQGDRFDPKLYSNIPMEKISKGIYKAKLAKLPEYDWAFTFVDSSGLIYGTNNSRTHTNTTICISIALYLAFYTAYRYYHKRYLLILGYCISVLYLFCFMGKLVDGYLGDAFLGLMLFIALVLVIPVTYFISRRHRVSKSL